MKNNMNYKTKIIHNIDKELITQWKDLWNRAENASIFNSYDWFLTCQELGHMKEYELYVCYKDDKLVAILPLSVYRKFGIKVSGVIGKDFLVDTAFLMETYEPELVKQFFSSIFTKRNIYIQKIDQQAVNILKNNFSNLFFSLMSVNPSMNLTGELFESVSKSTVSQIKSIIKKNPDQFSFKIFDRHNNIKEQLQTMFAVDQSSSKKLRSMDTFAEQKNKDFFSTISKNSDIVRLCFLYYNNLPIAYQFGFLYGNTFCAYQTSYLNEYRKLRPGKTMLFHLIEHLQELNVDILDLGGGISAYKQEFTQDYRLLYDVYHSKNIFVLQWWKLINLIRRKKQLIFPKKFTRDHEFLFKTL